VTDGWWKYGCAAVVGIDTYGESAPAPVLFKHFGFTAENVADAAEAVDTNLDRHDLSFSKVVS
jgi:transketolase